jgi:type III secretory pathway component EscU
MFDPTTISLNGVILIAVAFGLVEFIKSLFSLDGKKVTLISALVGGVLYALYALIGVLPPVYGQALTIVFTSVVFGLTASGYYKFAAARFTKPE